MSPVTGGGGASSSGGPRLVHVTGIPFSTPDVGRWGEGWSDLNCSRKQVGTGAEAPPGPLRRPFSPEIQGLVCPRAQVRPWALLRSAWG